MVGFMNTTDFNFNKNIKAMPNKFLSDRVITADIYTKFNIAGQRLDSVFPIAKTVVPLFCKKCMARCNFEFATVGDDMMRNPNGTINKRALRDEENKVCLQNNILRNRYVNFCARDEKGHYLLVNFEVISENTIRKIGQSPSPYEMTEYIHRPNLKQFLEKYNIPMCEYDLNRLDNDYIKRIKYETYEKVSVYNAMEYEEKITRYECNQMKNKIYEEFEKPRIVEYYNKIYNDPYGFQKETGDDINITYFVLE